LDTVKDALVEIAVLVTDSELNVIGDGVDVVIKATPEQLAGMDEFVTKMHTDSGLIEKIPNGITVSEAEDLILKFFGKFWSGVRQISTCWQFCLCGPNVYRPRHASTLWLFTLSNS